VGSNELSAVTFANSTFVTVGSSGAILTSPDGDHWTLQTSGVTEDLFGVAFGSGTFVAVGSVGTVLTSVDGAAWTAQTSGTTDDLFGVAFGNVLGVDTFVAVGGFGTILSSTDGGASWTARASGTSDDLFGAAFGVDAFVATGAFGIILTSLDGATWIPQDSGTSISIFGAGFGTSGFVTAGMSGTILQSFAPGTPPPPPSAAIRTFSPLPAGVVDATYSATLQAIGGSTPYSWLAVAGDLPAGLTLSTAGVISGTPTATGLSNFTIQVTDASSSSSQKAFSLTINAAPPPPSPMIASASPLPSGEVGKAYSFTFQAISGTPPYAWSVAGALPAGLTLSSAGLLSGTPTTANLYNFNIQVTDSESISVQAAFSVTINAPPPPPAKEFDDVAADHPMHDYIVKLYDAGVTGGCTGTSYCPDAPVTRGQMAVFLVTSLGQGSNNCAGDVYSDVNAATVGDAFCGYIERITADGITAGCGNGKYCPNDPITRGQMAVFIEVALGHSPNSGTGRFTDVPAGHPFAGYVELLSDDGITAGCGGGKYCVDDPISRAQMAVYLVAAPQPLSPD
jgi:hypothetical protein